jgi:hypothetical protein
LKNAFLLFVAFLAVTVPAQAKYGGGIGTVDEPYLINTAEQMNAVGTDANDWDKHFRLTADINLGIYTEDEFNIIGTSPNDPFTGVFDGNGHIISNFTYNSTGAFSYYIGLFGWVDSNDAEIKNLGVIDPNVVIMPYGIRAGALIGMQNSGTVSNCYVEGGSVSGDNSVGGLIGNNTGTVINCYTTCSVTAENSRAGGLVGWNDDGGVIINCSASGAVTGSQTVGGLVGKNLNNATTIANCYATGSVTGGDETGGLVGWNYEGSISNCYCLGTVIGSSYVGGLVGMNAEAPISNCYSIGSVSGDTKTGGLVGKNIRGGTVENSFWDVETSGQTTSEGGTDKTTAEMQDPNTFLDAGWDFVGESANGTDDFWTICYLGGCYPRLSWEQMRVYHVDVVDGNDDNNGLTPETAFATIQAGIDAAYDGEKVLVWPGVYTEDLDFIGKAITVTSATDAAVLRAAYLYAVMFYHGEDANSVFKNFIIKDSDTAIFLSFASPTISNLTVVDNEYGATDTGGSDPNISNCIFWNNTYVDLDDCETRYSCIEDGSNGAGNISEDPRFADANNGDYRLLSERGRYWPEHNIWVLDDVTSPCIDTGDPTINPSNERMPNGGRINMGAYGDTLYASMSEWPIKEDNNRDGIVNMVDFAMLAQKWLEKLDWFE